MSFLTNIFRRRQTGTDASLPNLASKEQRTTAEAEEQCAAAAQSADEEPAATTDEDDASSEDATTTDEEAEMAAAIAEDEASVGEDEAEEATPSDIEEEERISSLAAAEDERDAAQEGRVVLYQPAAASSSAAAAAGEARLIPTASAAQQANEASLAEIAITFRRIRTRLVTVPEVISQPETWKLPERTSPAGLVAQQVLLNSSRISLEKEIEKLELQAMGRLAFLLMEYHARAWQYRKYQELEEKRKGYKLEDHRDALAERKRKAEAEEAAEIAKAAKKRQRRMDAI